MFGDTGNSTSTLVMGIFCEAFGAASAIASLLRSGFADHEIQAVGVLEGHVPAISEFLLAIGLPSDLAASYSDCFDDGAVLLVVRVDQARKKKIAMQLLEHYGGVCAATNNHHASMSDSSPARDTEPHRPGGIL